MRPSCAHVEQTLKLFRRPLTVATEFAHVIHVMVTRHFARFRVALSALHLLPCHPQIWEAVSIYVQFICVPVAWLSVPSSRLHRCDSAASHETRVHSSSLRGECAASQ
eukprot:6039142-Pleurochrysis_carterae.AAC.1